MINKSGQLPRNETAGEKTDSLISDKSSNALGKKESAASKQRFQQD